MPSWYDRHVLPPLLDCACGLPMVTRQRRLVVPQARGRVLEIGIGTGLNLPHYDMACVTSLTGVDPGIGMHPTAARRARARGLDVRLVPLSAEQLPLPDASFDTVVVTYTLCTIPDPVAALREMRRVLAPGGQLLFCEHGRAPEPAVQRWQERLQPLWGRLAGGCHLGRDVPALLGQAGFTVPSLHTGYIPGPRPMTFHYWGRALGQSPDAHAPH